MKPSISVNGESIAIGDSPPSQTLLRFLRTDAALTGTKEGCASGDCGACTVLVAAPGQAPHTVNSCITPLGSVVGKQVITVEALAGEDATGVNRVGYHPVQNAMVECHGSQCGFCTPGFVMALAGAYQADIRSEAGIRDAISGNLCRCTGYKPILEAGQRMYDYPASPLLPDSGAGAQSEGSSAASDPLPAEYFRPETERDLQALMQRMPDAWRVAGGTDACLDLTQRYADPKAVIDFSSVAELCQQEVTEDSVVIGSAVTCTELETLFATLSPPLVSMLHRYGSRQIRNRATPGGNLAGGSPIADLPPVLLVWDADIEIASADGGRRKLPITEFHLDYRKTALAPNEYIAALHIPRASLAREHRIYKITKRFEDDISTVLGACSLSLVDGRVVAVRIAYGGMAATPTRVPAAESVLDGQLLDDDLITAACEAVTGYFKPLDDVRASAAYRSAMAAAMLRQTLLEMRDGVDLSIDAVEALSHA